MSLIEFGTIMNLTKGKKPKNQFGEYKAGLMPYVDIKAFETGRIESYTDGEKCLPCKEGDILIVCDGSRSGLVGKALNGYVGSTLAKISAEGLTQDYLYYFLQGQYALLNTKKKRTGTPHLNPELLRKQLIYVPSIEMQQRIVSRIEELFSELDRGVETLQTIKEQLAVYRQAVLKEEFDRAGENKSELKEIIEKPRYGTSKKCSSNAEEMAIPVYRIPNINYSQGIISHNDLKYASFTEDELSALKLKVGDILIIRSNGSVSLVGRTAVVSKRDIGGLFAGYLMRLRIKVEKKVLPQYLNLYLNTHYARNQIEMMAKSTSGVNNINATEICQIKIPICDIDLQKEIIEAIESKSSLCDSIEQTVDTALAQAEAMRQSILKKAFEGELCK